MSNEFRSFSKDATAWGFLFATALGAFVSLGSLFLNNAGVTNNKAASIDYSIVAIYSLCIFAHLRSYLRVILIGVEFDRKSILQKLPIRSRKLLYATFLNIVFVTALSLTILRVTGVFGALIAYFIVASFLVVLWFLTFSYVFIEEDKDNNEENRSRKQFFLSFSFDILTFVAAVFMFGYTVGNETYEMERLVGMLIIIYILFFLFECHFHIQTLKYLWSETKLLFIDDTVFEPEIKESVN